MGTTGYKIRCKKSKKGLLTETTPGNVRFHELKNLDRMSAYQIRMAAMTVNGSGPFSEWQHIETYQNDLDESQVPGAPGWIRSELKLYLLFFFYPDYLEYYFSSSKCRQHSSYLGTSSTARN